MPWQLSRVPKKPNDLEPLAPGDMLRLTFGLLPVAFFVHALTRAATPEAEVGSYTAAIIFGFVYLYLCQQE